MTEGRVLPGEPFMVATLQEAHRLVGRFWQVDQLIANRKGESVAEHARRGLIYSAKHIFFINGIRETSDGEPIIHGVWRRSREASWKNLGEHQLARAWIYQPYAISGITN